MSLEQQIDDLYKGSAAEFIAGRDALAKTLKGDEARRVKRLIKPTVVPWTVNQVYWRARPAYERLTEAGRQLRAAQLAALKGRTGDVRRAAEAHRAALARAVADGVRLAEEAGVRPNPEELARTFEAVSLARDLPEPPGRLTKALQPAGFEALAGVTGFKPRPERTAASPVTPAQSATSQPASRRTKSRAAAEAAERKRQAEAERKRSAAARRRQKDIDAATKAAARARAAEQRARNVWERARAALAAAELTLQTLQK